jgi:hypothetical protein
MVGLNAGDEDMPPFWAARRPRPLVSSVCGRFRIRVCAPQCKASDGQTLNTIEDPRPSWPEDGGGSGHPLATPVNRHRQSPAIFFAILVTRAFVPSHRIFSPRKPSVLHRVQYTQPNESDAQVYGVAWVRSNLMWLAVQAQRTL